MLEYRELMLENKAPQLRAWIREADKTIRINNELYGLKVGAAEDQPWLTRVWQSFLSLFTAK